MRQLGVPGNSISWVRPSLDHKQAIAWGRWFEPYACWVYEQATGTKPQDLGGLYALHDKYDFIGASPDAMVGPDGAVELKCPYSKQLPKKADLNYWIQCQVQMACVGPRLKWVDLAYWKPELMKEGDARNPLGMADVMRIFRVKRSPEFEREFIDLAVATWKTARSGRNPAPWSLSQRRAARARLNRYLDDTTAKPRDFRRTGGTPPAVVSDPSCYVFD